MSHPGLHHTYGRQILRDVESIGMDIELAKLFTPRLLSPLLQLINSVLHRPYSKGKCLSKEAVGNASTDDGDAVIRHIGRRAGGDGGVDGHNTPPDPR